MMQNAIRFYEPEDENGWLCNLSEHPVMIEGEIFRTVEHYYHIQKFHDTQIRSEIKHAPTAREAKYLSRAYSAHVRSDWQSVKEETMYRANFAKFMQHPDLLEKLLETGDVLIVEDAPTDSFWGCGADGKGQNVMGRILMQVRADLIRKEERK